MCVDSGSASLDQLIVLPSHTWQVPYYGIYLPHRAGTSISTLSQLTQLISSPAVRSAPFVTFEFARDRVAVLEASRSRSLEAQVVAILGWWPS